MSAAVGPGPLRCRGWGWGWATLEEDAVETAPLCGGAAAEPVCVSCVGVVCRRRFLLLRPFGGGQVAREAACEDAPHNAVCERVSHRSVDAVTAAPPHRDTCPGHSRGAQPFLEEHEPHVTSRSEPSQAALVAGRRAHVHDCDGDVAVVVVVAVRPNSVAEKHRQQGHERRRRRRPHWAKEICGVAVNLLQQVAAAPSSGRGRTIVADPPTAPPRPHNNVVQLVLVGLVDGKRRLPNTPHDRRPARRMPIEAEKTQQGRRPQRVSGQVGRAQRLFLKHNLAQRQPHRRELVPGVVVARVLPSDKLFPQQFPRVVRHGCS